MCANGIWVLVSSWNSRFFIVKVILSDRYNRIEGTIEVGFSGCSAVKF